MNEEKRMQKKIKREKRGKIVYIEKEKKRIGEVTRSSISKLKTE